MLTDMVEVAFIPSDEFLPREGSNPVSLDSAHETARQTLLALIAVANGQLPAYEALLKALSESSSESDCVLAFNTFKRQVSQLVSSLYGPNHLVTRALNSQFVNEDYSSAVAGYANGEAALPQLVVYLCLVHEAHQALFYQARTFAAEDNGSSSIDPLVHTFDQLLVDDSDGDFEVGLQDQAQQLLFNHSRKLVLEPLNLKAMQLLLKNLQLSLSSPMIIPAILKYINVTDIAPLSPEASLVLRIQRLKQMHYVLTMIHEAYLRLRFNSRDSSSWLQYISVKQYGDPSKVNDPPVFTGQSDWILHCSESNLKNSLEESLKQAGFAQMSDTPLRIAASIKQLLEGGGVGKFAQELLAALLVEGRYDPEKAANKGHRLSDPKVRPGWLGCQHGYHVVQSGNSVFLIAFFYEPRLRLRKLSGGERDINVRINTSLHFQIAQYMPDGTCNYDISFLGAKCKASLAVLHFLISQAWKLAKRDTISPIANAGLRTLAETWPDQFAKHVAWVARDKLSPHYFSKFAEPVVDQILRDNKIISSLSVWHRAEIARIVLTRLKHRMASDTAAQLDLTEAERQALLLVFSTSSTILRRLFGIFTQHEWVRLACTDERIAHALLNIRLGSVYPPLFRLPKNYIARSFTANQLFLILLQHPESMQDSALFSNRGASWVRFLITIRNGYYLFGNTFIGRCFSFMPSTDRLFEYLLQFMVGSGWVSYLYLLDPELALQCKCHNKTGLYQFMAEFISHHSQQASREEKVAMANAIAKLVVLHIDELYQINTLSASGKILPDLLVFVLRYTTDDCFIHMIHCLKIRDKLTKILEVYLSDYQQSSRQDIFLARNKLIRNGLSDQARNRLLNLMAFMDLSLKSHDLKSLSMSHNLTLLKSVDPWYRLLSGLVSADTESMFVKSFKQVVDELNRVGRSDATVPQLVYQLLVQCLFVYSTDGVRLSWRIQACLEDLNIMPKGNLKLSLDGLRSFMNSLRLNLSRHQHQSCDLPDSHPSDLGHRRVSMHDVAAPAPFSGSTAGSSRAGDVRAQTHHGDYYPLPLSSPSPSTSGLPPPGGRPKSPINEPPPLAASLSA